MEPFTISHHFKATDQGSADMSTDLLALWHGKYLNSGLQNHFLKSHHFEANLKI